MNAAYARASSQNRRGNFAAAIIDYQLALEKDQEKSNSFIHSPKRRPRRSLSFINRSSSDLTRSFIRESSDDPNKDQTRTLHGSLSTNISTVGETLSPNNSSYQNPYLRQSNGINTPQRQQAPTRKQDSENVSSQRGQSSTSRDPIPSQIQNHSRLSTREFLRQQKQNGDKNLDSERGSRHDTRDADYHHMRGFQHRKNGDFHAAIADYTRAIELNPRHFKAYFNRGFSYDKLGDFRSAIADYTKALEIDPGNAYTFYNLGISYDRCGQFQLAVENFSQAISIDPNNADFYHNRGFSFRKLGYYDNAIADYTRALEIEPRHFKAFYNRAFSFDKISDYERAILDYTAALNINPKNSNSYHNRGSAYEKLGKLNSAIQDFTAAIGLDAKNAASYNSRGLCFDKLRRYQEAVSDFTRAMSIDPNNPIFYHNRAITYRNM